MKDLSPIGWALRPLKRYAEFSGRSSRAEFWWFMLAIFVVYMVIWFAMFGAIMSAAMTQTTPSGGLFGAIGVGGIVVGLGWLALIVPTIAVQARRLHDTNRSGWWLGGFYLLYAVYAVLLLGSVGSMMRAAAAGSTAPPAPPNMSLVAGSGLLGLGMFVYMIVLLVFYCLPGTQGANRFGEDPYGANVEEVFA